MPIFTYKAKDRSGGPVAGKQFKRILIAGGGAIIVFGVFLIVACWTGFIEFAGFVTRTHPTERDVRMLARAFGSPLPPSLRIEEAYIPSQNDQILDALGMAYYRIGLDAADLPGLKRSAEWRPMIKRDMFASGRLAAIRHLNKPRYLTILNAMPPIQPDDIVGALPEVEVEGYNVSARPENIDIGGVIVDMQDTPRLKLYLTTGLPNRKNWQ